VAEPASALDGKLPLIAAGVEVAERRSLAMVQIVALAGAGSAVRAALVASGLGAPPGPNRTASPARATMLWLGPDRWLVVEPRDAGASSWHAALVAAGGILTDLGHSRTVIRIAGAAAREVLAAGVGPDLHPAVFPPGACLQTNLAHTNVLLHAVDPVPSFDLYVPRSYAADLWDWLSDAAAGIGVSNS
jgi:methylglutamate dehydrogenase subunit D